MDFSKGFLAKINMINIDYLWIQKVNYENVLFWCRDCFDKGHLAKNFLKASQKNNPRKSHHKSTWWNGAKFKHYIVFKNEGPLDADKIHEIPQVKQVEETNPSPKWKFHIVTRQTLKQENFHQTLRKYWTPTFGCFNLRWPISQQDKVLAISSWWR